MFVDELKRADFVVLFMSRLVSRKYSDQGSAQIETKAPTVQRFTQPIVFALVAPQITKVAASSQQG